MPELTFPKNSRQTYDRLAEYFRRKIHSKEFASGSRLPNTTDLVKLTGAGSTTVRKALAELESDGLIKSTRGRGTFVVQKELGEAKSEHVKTITIAIMGLVPPETITGEYRSETAAGFLKECDKLGLASLAYPYSFRGKNIDELYQILLSSQCNGLIWPVPVKQEIPIIRELMDRGMPVVITGRCTSEEGLASVESDFETAGFSAGTELIKQGCKSVLLLTHFVNFGNNNSFNAELPTGLKGGIAHAFEAKFGSDRDRIECEKHEGYSKEVSQQILERLEKISPDCGVIFTNGYQFYQLLKDYNEPAIGILKNIKFCVVGNKSINIQLVQLVDGLDFCVLIDQYEQIARIAVQKAMSRISGFFSDTKTLVRVECKKFK